MQWITLFDHPDDDIYDGLLNENDEEVPRIQFEFVIDEIDAKKPAPSNTDFTAKARPATAAGASSKVGQAMKNKTNRPGSGGAVNRPGSGRPTPVAEKPKP